MGCCCSCEDDDNGERRPLITSPSVNTTNRSSIPERSNSTLAQAPVVQPNSPDAILVQSANAFMRIDEGLVHPQQEQISRSNKYSQKINSNLSKMSLPRSVYTLPDGVAAPNTVLEEPLISGKEREEVETMSKRVSEAVRSMKPKVRESITSRQDPFATDKI